MGMFDEYRISGDNRCPVCGDPMKSGQGKWGPNFLLVFTEGAELPANSPWGDPEWNVSPEKLAEFAQELPDDFWFSFLDCALGHQFIGNGSKTGGRWTTTKLYLDRHVPLLVVSDYVVWRVSKEDFVVAPSRWVCDEAVVRGVTALAWNDRYIVCTVRHAPGQPQDALWLIDVAAHRARGPLTAQQYESLCREIDIPEAWRDVADLNFERLAIT